MKSAQHVIRLLGRADITEADIWDLVPAARGITVLLLDGKRDLRVLALPLADGSARQLLHLWSVETKG